MLHEETEVGHAGDDSIELFTDVRLEQGEHLEGSQFAFCALGAA